MILSDLLSVFTPHYCRACGKMLKEEERFLCRDCSRDLEETHFHLRADNEVMQLLSLQNDITAAMTLFYFQKGSVAQHLIHHLKYRGEEQIGEWLGNWLGNRLSQSPLYQLVEVVIPVPLHRDKLKKRGYNQVALLAKTIAKVLGVSYVDDVLLKVTANTTQTRKISWRRLEESEHIFVLQHPEKLKNKHILLIDDLITTGATLSHCCEQLSTIEGVQIAVAGIGFTIRS